MFDLGPQDTSLFDDLFADPDGLRWYQREAVDSVLRELAEHRSTLLVAATGTGKTQMFGAITRHWPGNVLILAHRDELVSQARKRVEKMTGEWVEIEKAAFRCTSQTRIVVGSMQTLGKQKRLEALPRDRFSLVIIDEAHRAMAPTYRKICAYFSEAKVLGVTATPDRGDGVALKQAFETVAYEYDIEAGIDDGFLVPIHGRQVELAEINLSGITKTKGDLAEGQLDEAMVRACEGVVKETVRLEPDRQAIVFWPGIKSAELGCARFNEIRPNSAIFICAQTEEDERKRLVEDFRRGVYQYFCNVGIATEGFDAPDVSLVVVARPTLSRALYAQMVGRGTRILAGLVDALPAREDAAQRRALIAASAKPNCMILDFVGNSGKHSLVGPVDILGGKYTEEERKRAKKVMEKEPGSNPREALERARAELRALAKMVKSTVKANVRNFNPFDVMHMSTAPSEAHALKVGHKPMTKEMISALRNYGVEDAQMAKWSQYDGQRFCQAQRVRLKNGLCSYRMLLNLRRVGVNEVNISYTRAKMAMAYLQRPEVKWGRGVGFSPATLDKILHPSKEAVSGD